MTEKKGKVRLKNGDIYFQFRTNPSMIKSLKEVAKLFGRSCAAQASFFIKQCLEAHFEEQAKIEQKEFETK